MYPAEFVKLESLYEVTIAPLIEDTSKDWKLPPLTLRFSFPDTYPQKDAPTFSLLAPWLNREDGDNVKNAMLESWTSEGVGSPIMFTWIEWYLRFYVQGFNSRLALGYATTSSRFWVGQRQT